MKKQKIPVPKPSDLNEALTLLQAVINAIETYRNPNHRYDDTLRDLFAGFLHLNGETHLFIDPIEQSLFDKLFDMLDEQFNALFQFCLDYFSSPVDDIEEYFGLSDRKQLVFLPNNSLTPMFVGKRKN